LASEGGSASESKGALTPPLPAYRERSNEACATDAPSSPTKILLIAGKKSHGPGEHEYEKGMRLLVECLNTSPNVKNVRAEVVTDGWPADPKAFDGVGTVVLFCDGADRDEKAHPLLHGDRLDQLGALMKRGVGFVAIHYTVFVPTERGGKQFQEWLGGYFDYDSSGNAREKWYSKLGHATTTSTLLAKNHPISRGVEPFTTKTEYYWRMHFKDDDKRLTPLLTFDPKSGLETTVGWAVERADGGRGFGFTEGHFHSNWQIESFRKFVLNGIVWTAKVEVPEGGVKSTLPKE
jgi:type 1 glutamine amidotransferase